MEIVLAHPGGYAMVHLKGCAGFFLPGATAVLEVAGVTRGQLGTLAVLQEQGLPAAARNYFGDDAAAWTIGILLALIPLGGRSLQDKLPFGCFLAPAAVGALLVGRRALEAYMQLLGRGP